MSTGLPAAPNGGMNLRNAASRSAGIAISDNPLSTQASESSTPEPPAPVMITTLLPFGVGKHGNTACEVEQVAQAPRADDSGLLEHVLVDLIVAGERAGMRACRSRAHAGAPGLQDHLWVSSWIPASRPSAKARAVLQSFTMPAR